jgi:hypothetical protein
MGGLHLLMRDANAGLELCETLRSFVTKSFDRCSRRGVVSQGFS